MVPIPKNCQVHIEKTKNEMAGRFLVVFLLLLFILPFLFATGLITTGSIFDPNQDNNDDDTGDNCTNQTIIEDHYITVDHYIYPNLPNAVNISIDWNDPNNNRLTNYTTEFYNHFQNNTELNGSYYNFEMNTDYLIPIVIENGTAIRNISFYAQVSSTVYIDVYFIDIEDFPDLDGYVGFTTTITVSVTDWVTIPFSQFFDNGSYVLWLIASDDFDLGLADYNVTHLFEYDTDVELKDLDVTPALHIGLQNYTWVINETMALDLKSYTCQIYNFTVDEEKLNLEIYAFWFASANHDILNSWRNITLITENSFMLGTFSLGLWMEETFPVEGTFTFNNDAITHQIIDYHFEPGTNTILRIVDANLYTFDGNDGWNNAYPYLVVTLDLNGQTFTLEGYFTSN